MQPSEIFVCVWSVGATLVASYYYVQFSKADGMIGMLLQSISDIHEGKAEITKRGDRITVKYIGDDDGDTSK